MQVVETLLFFHPMPPDPHARLATIGMRLPEQEDLREDVKLELQRHSSEGIPAGYWGENMQIWFIEPGIWACMYNLLARHGCAPSKDEDPQWRLYRLKYPVRELACKQHYTETINWHLLITERNLKAWAEKIRVVELFSYQELDEDRRKTQEWVQAEREQLQNRYEELAALKRELLELTSKIPSPDEDWLSSLEDKMNDFYRKLGEE